MKVIAPMDELGGPMTFNHYTDRMGARDGHALPVD